MIDSGLFGKSLSAVASFRFHWTEYLMEAGELGLYMFFACAFATLLQHPGSPVRNVVPNATFRRTLMGLAMGTTATSMVLSPWGQQSGGHIKPAITVAFYRLGEVARWDLVFYATGHFLGAIAGVTLAALVLIGTPGNEAVQYAITRPGTYGSAVTFLAEMTISFTLMLTVLFLSSR